MKNLRKLRKERGLTQEEFGRAIGVSQQSINKYETGRTEPDFRTVMAFAEFFHTSVDYLIGYTDNPDTHRIVTDLTDSEHTLLSPYILDKMKKGKPSSLQSLHESPSYEAPGLFDTTPKERHHLTMYRKLTPGMQFYLDSFLECIAPDNSYTAFRKSEE